MGGLAWPVRSPWPIRPVTIADAPRFAWRGIELDVARHFFTVPEVERLIDLASTYTLNVLHLHLTDDQGWRLPMPGRPLLESVGGRTQVGESPAGSYSVGDSRAIVTYAAAHFMTVVPEVDMPSHVGAALASYPSLACDGQPPISPWTSPISLHRSLCVGSKQVTRFLHDVVSQLVRRPSSSSPQHTRRSSGGRPESTRSTCRRTRSCSGTATCPARATT